MTAIDWTKNFEKYKGLWVAMKEDQKTVVASGKTLREAKNKAEDNGYRNSIFFRVPLDMMLYIGGAL